MTNLEIFVYNCFVYDFWNIIKKKQKDILGVQAKANKGLLVLTRPPLDNLIKTFICKYI